MEREKISERLLLHLSQQIDVTDHKAGQASCMEGHPEQEQGGTSGDWYQKRCSLQISKVQISSEGDH